jgi:hypothetical protein
MRSALIRASIFSLSIRWAAKGLLNELVDYLYSNILYVKNSDDHIFKNLTRRRVLRWDRKNAGGFLAPLFMLRKLCTEFAYLWVSTASKDITAGQTVSVPRIDVHNQRSGKEGLKHWLEPFPIDFFDGTV